MPFSQASRTRLSFVKEVTYGVTPAGNFQVIPFTSNTLDLAKDRVQGTDIQADRMVRHDRHGNRSVAGDITVDMRGAAYDAFLESLMFNTWDSTPVNPAPDLLRVGTTLQSLSIEDYAADIDQAKLFEGMIVNSASFSIKPNQMVQTTFSLIGQDMAISQTQRTTTAAVTNVPFDSYSGAISIGNAGGALTGSSIITGIDFTVNNNANPTYVVGSAITPEMEYGLCTVEGTLTAYFDDAALLTRFINETETAIRVGVNIPGGGATSLYSFFFPRVKINGGNVPATGQASRVLTLPFVALFDSTANSSLVIERPAT
jgi:hypothetical protein